MAWLRLIRWKNLAIVLLTQCLAWYCLVWDTSHYFSKPLFLGHRNFFHLLLSTLLITAAGYIINDYFDIKIDNINKPGKIVLVNKIPLRSAIIAHAVLNILALGFCFIVAAHGGYFSWMSVQLGSILLLWFYSTHFKRQFMIGNLVVAFLSALTIGVVLIYEPMMYEYIHKPLLVEYYNTESYINPFWAGMAYCTFAFILTWIREIVKDIEDIKGDTAEGCTTMPVKFGPSGAIMFAQVLAIITALALFSLAYFLHTAKYSLLGIYACFFLAFPLIVWSAYLPQKNTSQHYHKASGWLKIIMLLGICSLFIFHFYSDLITCIE
jgi:4-hydroxybenzoate polyprenyltransferase